MKVDKNKDLDGPLSRNFSDSTQLGSCKSRAGADVTDADPGALQVMPDAADVSDWATESVVWCLNKKVISGVNETDGRYVRPGKAVDRATMAQMMKNTIEGGVL